jgi:hypothetical protein
VLGFSLFLNHLGLAPAVSARLLAYILWTCKMEPVGFR